MKSGGPALRCRGLVKRYADVVAVNGLDLEVRRGECFGLLGPNGAGKTTSIEILEGLMPADAGGMARRLARLSLSDRLWLATHASELRRRPRDQLALATMLLLGVLR